MTVSPMVFHPEVDMSREVVTALKLRARRYPDKIFCGIILCPYSSLPEISKKVADMAARTADGKVAMHVVNRGPGMGEPGPGPKPGIAIMPYDAHGEAHARSEAGFKWAFDIEGGQEFSCGEMTLRQVNAVAETFRAYQGNNMFWLSAPLLARIDDETLIRAWKWYEDAIEACPGFDDGSTVLLEFMQEVCHPLRRNTRSVLADMYAGCNDSRWLPKRHSMASPRPETRDAARTRLQTGQGTRQHPRDRHEDVSESPVSRGWARERNRGIPCRLPARMEQPERGVWREPAEAQGGEKRI